MLLTDIVPNLPSDLKNLFKDHLEKFIYATFLIQIELKHPVADSSKTAPRILIFSIAIAANYSYEMKNSEI